MPTFWNPDERTLTTPLRALLLGLILAAGVLLRLHDLRDPWPENLHGYNGAYNSLSARNYLRYGYWKLRLAQIWQEGGPVTEESEKYYNHPPLLPLLVSFSFKMFGTDAEWSARLVPIFFSTATLLMLYWMACYIWGEVIALPAIAILAVVPMATYYGSNVCYEPLLTFFALATFYLYARYLERPTGGRFAAMLGAMLLGGLSDWMIFYCVPLFVLGSLVYQAPPRTRMVIELPIWAGLMLVAIIVCTLGGEWRIFTQNILRNVLSRSDAAAPAANQTITWASWLRQVTRDNIEYHTLPLLILAVVWVARTAWRLPRRSLTKEDALAGMLLAFGACNIILGWRWVIDHVYWASLITPGLAIAAALALLAIYDGVVRWRAGARPFLIGLGMLLMLAYSYQCGAKLYALHRDDTSVRDLGKMLRRNTQFEGIILTSEDWDLPPYRFYADRNFKTNLRSIAEFAEVYNEYDQAFYFALPVKKRDFYPELYELLDQSFRSWIEDGQQVFEMQLPKISDDSILKLIHTMKDQYTFAAHLNQIKATPANQPIPPEQAVFEINGSQRAVLLQSAPSEWTFADIPMKPAHSLKVGLAINPDVWQEPDAARTFEIRLTDEQGERPVFTRSIDPYNNPEDRNWIEALVPLDTTSAAASLTLSVRSDAEANEASAVGGWYTLRLASSVPEDTQENQVGRKAHPSERR